MSSKKQGLFHHYALTLSQTIHSPPFPIYRERHFLCSFFGSFVIFNKYNLHKPSKKQKNYCHNIQISLVNIGCFTLSVRNSLTFPAFLRKILAVFCEM